MKSEASDASPCFFPCAVAAGVWHAGGGAPVMCSQRSACLVHRPVGSRIQMDLTALVREGKREGHGTGTAVLAVMCSTRSHLLISAAKNPVPPHPG